MLVLINCSVVLLAKDQFPSVNHDFLVNKKIIPENFQKKNNSISTPVISQVHYNNGFTLIVEPKKTSIQFHALSFDEQKNLENLKFLKDIASKYIECFEYIKYQAIGLNFDCIQDEMQYDSFIQKIIKNGSCPSFEGNNGEVPRIDLSYNLEGKQFNVKVIKAERVSENPDSQTTASAFAPFFKINVNYPEAYAKNKVTITEELEENYSRLKKFIGSFQ